MARKILLADDSVTAQNMGRKILADAGYEVITVNNGSAALKKIAEIKPDLIVLDVYMPGYSGLEVCQRVKEAGETSRIPILLTVGKLEPFKPEEAKRVRAEGFIVKPFEASELLSALAKLEDKIVPRSESSKPGRFARAIAAVEEGRYDKSVAMDEDSGWKNRISFPSKKKRAPEPEDGDDPAIYNALNKDLRTVIDHHRAPVAHEAAATETKVDVGALAPEGLPKDVTPEEIAALAAAAAQIQGIAEAKPAEAKPADVQHVEPPAAEAVPHPTIVSSHEAAPEPAKIESETATQAQPQDASESTAEIASAITQSDLQAATEKETATEAPAGIPSQTTQEVASLAVPSPADVMAAISSLETAATPIAPTMSSADGSSSDGSAPQPEAEPVTMAVAAGAEHAAVSSRWTAVSIALATEETAINLAEEMRKAQVYMAVADTPPVETAASVPEIQSAPVEAAIIPETASPVEPEHQVSMPASVEPETPSTVATSTTAEVVHTGVKEFETVTASSSSVAAKDAAPAEAEPAPPQTDDSAAPPPALEQPQVEEAKAEEIPIAQVAETEPPATEAVATPTHHEEPTPEESKPAEPSQVIEEQKSEEPVIAAPMASVAQVQESPAVVEKMETAEAFPVSQIHAEEAPTAELSVPAETTHGGKPDMAKRESEIAATTAAAWASWRRIRETGDPRDSAQSKNNDEENFPSPPEEAAMAVAAGAEKAPEEVPAASESPEIASIVESVLADLRPKIVEEISRKLGKKKK